MARIMTHSASVQPLARLSFGSGGTVFAGEIETFLEDPTLITSIEEDEVSTTIEEDGELVTTVEQEELEVEVEEDTV